MKQLNRKKRIKTVRFIPDEPAKEDFFDTHSGIVSAIAEAVETNPHLKVIGLLGKWGSGKSTIVDKFSSLCDKDETDKKVHVFTYDTWVYQKDPVRRSFLESFISFLLEAKLVQNKKWTAKLDELSGKIQKTDVTNSPELTSGAKWMLSSLLPIPIAMSLVGLDTVKDAFGAETTLAGIWSLRLAFTLFLLPLITAAGLYLKTRYWDKDTEASTPLFPVLLNRTVERSRSTTIRSPEPTAIEFRKVFEEIMIDISSNERRFVLVIDNLDRLPGEEAVQMWATIRSFFLGISESSQSHQPIVIVPIDKESIKRMFVRMDSSENAEDLADAFISKTFDVTFHVNEPVMSDWRGFMIKQLNEAFDHKLERDQIFWTRRFYEDEFGHGKHRITPRDINKFVNRLASLFLQWKDEVPFEVMAYYCVLGKKLRTEKF